VLISILGSLASSILEERVVTTPYTLADAGFESTTRYFRFPVFLNAVTFFFNALIAGVYLLIFPGECADVRFSRPTAAGATLMVLIAIANNFGSKLGSGALAYVDYSALLVAKSCMLVPVVFLNVVLLQKRYSSYRYLLFSLATIGLILFTLPGSQGNKFGQSRLSIAAGPLYGLALLLVNLLLDGSTYIVLEHIVSSPSRYGQMKGAHRMFLQNGIATAFTVGYLLLVQSLPGLVGHSHRREELYAGFRFLLAHPQAIRDLVGYAVCSAVAQLMLFATFKGFSSVLQMQIRVLRKTLAMLLSVTWFDKSLTLRQGVGVTFVFGAIIAEALEGARKEKEEQQSTKVKAT
jgi:UDP-galactose transporter B1